MCSSFSLCFSFYQALDSLPMMYYFFGFHTGTSGVVGLTEAELGSQQGRSLILKVLFFVSLLLLQYLVLLIPYFYVFNQYLLCISNCISNPVLLHCLDVPTFRSPVSPIYIYIYVYIYIYIHTYLYIRIHIHL